MKKWMIRLISVSFALAVVGAVTGFTLSGGSASPAEDLTGVAPHSDPTYDEWMLDFGDGIGDGKVLTIADDIDPELILEPSSPMKPICVDFGCGIGDGEVVTSIDDIDPNVCNAVHNINACTTEELEELGMDPAWYTITDVEYSDDGPNGEPIVGEFEPGWAVDGVPEPEVQSHEEGVRQDCGLAGGTVSVTSDGEVECHIVLNLEDGGEGETQAQPPVVLPDPEPLPAE